LHQFTCCYNCYDPTKKKMEWFNQLRDLVVNFWDWKESDTHDAQLSELAEETSSHVEEENKSDDEGEEKEEMKEEKEGKEEEKEESAISEERLNTTKKALAFNNEFLHQKEDVENSAKMYGLFNSTSKDNVKKTRRSVPANLSTTTIPMRATTTTTIPMMRASPRRRRQLLPLTSLTTALGPSESPAAAAAVKESSLFNVEVRLTRLQEKVAMEEMKEERKKVPQFGLLNPNISRRVRGVKRSFKSEEMDLRRSKRMRTVE